MRINTDFDFRHLSAAERIQLAQDLWDSLDPAEIEAECPLTPEQAAELDRTLRRRSSGTRSARRGSGPVSSRRSTRTRSGTRAGGRWHAECSASAVQRGVEAVE